MKYILAIFIPLFLSGCASFNEQRMDSVKDYAPTTPDSVRVFTEEPKEHYIVIAEITAEGETLSNSQGMEQRLKEKAAQMGAEAIILKVKKQMPGMITNNMVQGNSYVYDYNEIFGKKMTAKAIRFKK